MKKQLFIAVLCSIICFCGCSSNVQRSRTRGIGVYPGDPSETFAPVVKPGGNAVRNIALLRAASHSSSADYNQTAQLLTDGILPEGPAKWIELSVDGRQLTRQEEGYLTDQNVSSIQCSGPSAFMTLRFHGYEVTADRIIMAAEWDVSENAVLKVEGENAGEWRPLGSAKAKRTTDLVGENSAIRHHTEFVLDFPEADSFTAFRFSVKSPGVFGVNEVFFYKDGKMQDVLPGRFFTSSWKSRSAENEWVAIDLGSPSTFSKMNFHWVNGPSSATVQASDDGKSWRPVQ